MLRQNFGQSGQTARTNVDAGFERETAGDEALRTAYMNLVGQSGRVVSGKALKDALNRNTTPQYSGREPFSFTAQEPWDRKISQSLASPRSTSSDSRKRNGIAGSQSTIPSNDAGFSAKNDSRRSLKLPKFLVGPEIKSEPRHKESQALERYDLTAGKTSGRTLLPPIPQNLLGDLKPKAAQHQLEDNLNQQSDSRAQFSALPEQQSSSQSAAQSLPVKKSQDSSAAPSFASFLTENPAPTFSASNVPVERDTDWVNRYQRYESSWVKLLERPKLLLSLLGLGIVGCSVYIALGYWWFGSSPVSQAAEPLTMLNVQEDAVGKHDEQNATSTFNNIHSLQQNARNQKAKRQQTKPATSKMDGVLLAQAHPAPEPTNAPTSNKEPLKYEPTGRPDPFLPLVTMDGGSVLNKPAVEEKQDIFSEISYNGFIGDINSPDKVAIIKVNNLSNNTAKTYIKKAGEAININGERVVIKAISKKNLLMSASGEIRHLPIQQYQTLKPNPSGAGNGPSNGGPGPSGSGPAGGGSSAGGPMGASGPSHMNAPGGSNVSLNEPAN